MLPRNRDSRRAGSGQLQRFNHKALFVTFTLCLISSTCVSIANYGTAMIISNFAWDLVVQVNY